MLRLVMRRSWAISLLILALLSPPLAAQAPSPGVAPTPEPPAVLGDAFFGVVQALDAPEMASAAGVTWERLLVWWSAFQPGGPDTWNEQAWLPRQTLQEERERGIEPVGIVLHTPPWAAREDGDPAVSPPKNLELPFDDPANYWGQFMARLARDYAGVVDTWIVWNEPEFCWTGTVAEYAQLQRVAYLAIKAANPASTVILTGTTYWQDHEKGQTLFLERLLAELAKDPEAQAHGFYFDALAVHQYGNPLNSYTVPVLYRRILQSYALDKPIWLPESNVVPYDDPLKPLMRGGLRASMDEQASYVIQSVALARAAGVERYAIYKMRDEQPENDQYYGLVRNDGTPRPAYTAYQVAVRELSGVEDAQYFWSGSATPPTEDEITALLASTSSRAQFVWPGALNGVRMRRGADRVTVLWNASAAPLEIGVPSSVITATVMDKYGIARPLEQSEAGAFTLTLAAATNNTDARDPSLVLVGGDPVILVEPNAAGARDPLPRRLDACWNVPGALVPTSPTPSEAWVAPTGYAVSGPWLEYLRTYGDVANLGYPRSPVVVDPLDDTQCVQYFQRVVLEWHPDNPPELRIQRRLLGGVGGATPPTSPSAANGTDYWHFPFGERGLGHAVTNYAPDGTRIGFKEYFGRQGGENAFGYPMEPPTRRTGSDGVTRWTQRFQAAYFEYHEECDLDGVKPDTDLPWRTWLVQLRLLGDEYLREAGLPFVSGDAAQHVPRPPEPVPTP